MEDDRRSSVRHKTLKSGQIVSSNRCSVDCIVRNLSEGGAKLQVDPLFDVPELFTLVFLDGSKQVCQVIWRKGLHIGVEFLQSDVHHEPP